MSKQRNRKSRQEIETEKMEEYKIVEKMSDKIDKQNEDDDEEGVYLPEFIEQTVFSALSEQDFTVEHMPDLVFSLIDIAAKWHIIIGGEVNDFNSATNEIISEYFKNKDSLIKEFENAKEEDNEEATIDFEDQKETSYIENQIESDENKTEKLAQKKAKKEPKEKKQNKKSKKN